MTLPHCCILGAGLVGLAIAVACNSSTAADGPSSTAARTPAPVGTIVVAPAVDTIGEGAQLQLSDTAKDLNGNVLDTAVTWTSSNTDVAWISSTGQLLGRAAGTATITASLGGKTGSNRTVVADTGAPASIALVVSPDSAVTIPNPVDVLVQLTATVKTMSGRVLSSYPVVFTSSDPRVTGSLDAGPDTVVGGSILIDAEANGRAVITATAGQVSAQAPLTVCYVAEPTPICNPLASIEVAPPVDTIAVGDSVQMEAIGIDSSGNQYPNMFVEWDPGDVVSSDSSRVIVAAPDGEVYGLNPGTQYVDADIQGASGLGELTVVPAPTGTVVASAVAIGERRARVMAAVTRARARAVEAINRTRQDMRVRLAAAMRGAPSRSLRAYYARMLARIDTEGSLRLGDLAGP